MRRFAAVLIAFFALNAFAHDHDAADSEHLEHLRMMMHAMSQHGPMIPQPDALPEPTAAITQNITAKCFSFSPSAFTVHQGDVVTINISVPSIDNAATCQGIGHGILMDTYIENGVNVGRGQSKTITFTATTIGQFVFICTQSTCGNGHTSMIGTMTVAPQANPAPTITTISPNSGPPAGGTTVTISGTNFNSGATVKFGGTAATSVVAVSPTSITATTPAHAEGAVDVVVTNSDGQSATLSQAFTFAALKITSVSPNTGSTSGGTNVTIAGTNFQTGATVRFGARAATNVTVSDSNTILATTPLGPANEQLQVDVTVTNPDGTAFTLPQGFTYTVPPLQVSSISPNVLLPGGGTVVTITGAGFTSALSSSVTFGGVPATNVTIIDPVTLQATAPAHAVGTVDVAVTVGGLTVVKSGAATYQNAKPRHRSVKH